MMKRALFVVATILAFVIAGCSGPEAIGNATPTTLEGGPMEIDGWALYGKLVDTPWSELTEAQQRLVAFADLRSEVNNGGFDQYFFNSAGDHAETAVEAARVAGADALADLVLRAMQEIPGGYTANRDQRQGALEELETDALAALDDEFFDLEASVDLDRAMTVLARSA